MLFLHDCVENLSKSIYFFPQGLQSDGRAGKVTLTKSSLFSVIWQVTEVRVVLEADWLSD